MRQPDPHQLSKYVKPNDYGYLVVGPKVIHRMYKNDKRREEPAVKSLTLFNKIFKSIMTKIWHAMIKDRWIFKAPAHFGLFYIGEHAFNKGFFKDKRPGPDHIIEEKKYNFHTNGRIFKFKWNKWGTKFPFKKYYGLKTYRGSKESLTGKRGMAAWIQHCSVDPYTPDFRGHLI